MLFIVLNFIPSLGVLFDFFLPFLGDWLVRGNSNPITQQMVRMAYSKEVSKTIPFAATTTHPARMNVMDYADRGIRNAHRSTHLTMRIPFT